MVVYSPTMKNGYLFVTLFFKP